MDVHRPPEELSVAIGETRLIELESAAGAGYQWTVEFASGSQEAAWLSIRYGSLPEVQVPQNRPAPTFLSVEGFKAGQGVWHLRLARPWSPKDPLYDATIEILVSPTSKP